MENLANKEVNSLFLFLERSFEAHLNVSSDVSLVYNPLRLDNLYGASRHFCKTLVSAASCKQL